MTLRLPQKDSDGFERIVFGEVLIPDEPNVFGDFHTEQSVREFAYGFMLNGFGINHEHDNPDISNEVSIVESFIARPGDPDFIVGAWVLGVFVGRDDVWQAVLDGEVNGFSYEALVKFFALDLIVPNETTRYGRTEPALTDGHTHDFFVLLDLEGRVITGGTTTDHGHSHTISQHTFTDEGDFDGHIHIFNVIPKVE
jgi:hypothetical protein